MPPFSSAIGHQIQHYSIANDSNGGNAITEPVVLVARRLTAEGKAFLGREQTHEDFAFESSDTGREEKYDKETNDEYNLDSIAQSLETTKLDIDSVLDEFEDIPLYECEEYSHQELSYNCIHSQPEATVVNRSLFTIPEHRVSFAAKAFGGFILDDVNVKLIPHINEYTSDDKRSMWYTRSELNKIRKSCFCTAKVVSRDAELYCPYFIRGLEHLIEQYRQHDDEHEDNESNTGSDYNTGFENEVASTSESRRWDAVEAVLSEQERQRKFNTNSTIYGRMANPEKIRSVYAIEGKIATSQAIARTKALKDEACAKEWLMKAAPTSLSPNATHDRIESAYHYNDDEVDYHENSSSNSRIPKTIQHVFQKVLSPFVELREGDIFIEMGDEYFLAHA